MSVIKWDPFKNMAMLQDRINRVFDDAFPQAPGSDEELSQCAWKPLIDIYESDDGVVIQVDLPGVLKEDVSVEVKNNRLVIQGLRQVQSGIRDEQYYRRERICGTFQRSFALRVAILPDSIKASFKNGVLTVIIPKPEEDKPKKISVNID